MKLFLELSGNTIIGHDYYSHNEYAIEVDVTNITNSDGYYCYKYVEGELVALSQQEIESHPNYKARKLNELKQQVQNDIHDLDELKVHSLIAKQVRGGFLTQDEQSFVDNFISQRDALLAQYELDKQAYE